MKKPAFTMLELVMVIVVLGILVAMALPRMQQDFRQEAGDNILSAIRYTQHLALMDDKTDANDTNWQKKYWHIRFGGYDSNASWFYTISSNTDGNKNVDKDETAIDPANGKYMYHLPGDTVTNHTDESPNIFISKKYGINSVTLIGGCSAAHHVAFDHLGRPHVGIYGASNIFDKLMAADCTITFGFKGGGTPLKITIARETGYAQIVDQNGS